MLLLPAIDFLEHRLPDEVANSIEVVVSVDDPDEILVVTAFDPTGDRHFWQDLLTGFGER